MKLLDKSKDMIRSLLGMEPPVSRGALEIASLPRLLGTTGAVILEVGCNDGTDTQRFLEAFGEKARIFAFEPEPRAIKRFQKSVTDARVQLFEYALSDIDGTVEFHSSSGVPESSKLKDYRPEGWDLSGSIMKPKEHLERHPWCRFDETITIRTKTLDTWCQEQKIDEIDFIWVDVQGAEERFISGARQSLNQTRFLYTEYSNRELYEGQVNLRRLLELLPEFDVVTRYPGDVLLKNRSLA